MRLFRLPHPWHWASLKDVAASIPNAIVDGPFGSNLKVSDYIDRGVPVLQGKNITDDTFQWFDVRYISERKAETLKRSSVRIGDILIVKIGSIGFSAVVSDLRGHAYAMIPANLAKMTPSPDVIDTAYLRHWLTNPLSKDYLIGAASKTAQPALSLAKIKQLPVPLPPLSEQRRIAAILDQADALRAKRREALAQLDTLTQSLFLEMFGDPAANPNNWPLQSLGQVTTKFSDGPFGSNLKTSHYTETGVRVVRLQNIGVGEFLDEDRAYIAHEHFADLSKHKCLPGDLLIGTLGNPNLRACIQPSWLSVALNKADCVQARPDYRITTPEYLCAVLNQPSTQQMAHDLILGQTRLRISMGRLRGLRIPVPPLPPQRQFAEQMSAVERLKAKQRASLAKLDELFASLQYRAFRGEL